MSAPAACLFVSGFLPSRSVPSGGQKLVNAILREKAAQGPVVLLAFCNDQEKAHWNQGEFDFCSAAAVFPLTRADRLVAAVRHPSLPLVTSARYAAASRWWRNQGRSWQFGEVWIEFMQGASVLDLLPSDLPSTLVVHDVLHQALERRSVGARGWARWMYRLEGARTRRWESKVLRRAGRVLTLTDKDRDLIRICAGRTDVEVRYPVVDECYRRVRRGPETVERDTILFWGQMSRQENVDAVRWFAEAVLPAIRRERPSVRFLIAGANPTPEVRALVGAGVEVLGFVEDPVALFGRVGMAVAPLRLGSGIKIKVIESLAAGIPTVATPVGAEGVRPEPLLTVATEPEEFARRCCERLAG
jgi:glycosyltransferase involved in cell wall biosynthesis